MDLRSRLRSRNRRSLTARVEFFVDGNLVQKINNTTLNVFSATQAFNSYIGRHVSGGYYTNFRIDDFRIYNYVFTPPAQCIQIVGGTWGAMGVDAGCTPP